MKKHNFKEALEIFKAMFEGWVAVTKGGEKHAISGIDLQERHVMGIVNVFDFEEISHIEQTKQINGDIVMAWDDENSLNITARYVGKLHNGMHIIEDEDGDTYRFDKVELTSPTRKLTIQEATEMLKGIINEPFEITK